MEDNPKNILSLIFDILKLIFLFWKNKKSQDKDNVDKINNELQKEYDKNNKKDDNNDKSIDEIKKELDEKFK